MQQRLPQFARLSRWYAVEQVFGESRLDFLLEGPQGKCYVETKSVTLVEDGVGPVSRCSDHSGRQTPA